MEYEPSSRYLLSSINPLLRYRIEIAKIIQFLKTHQEKSPANSDNIGAYLEEIGDDVLHFVGDPAPLHELEPEAAAKMEHLCQEWQSKTKAEIWKRLKTAKFKIDISTVEALAGSERLEVVWLRILC